MVGRWPGRAPRALVMHADPLSAYAYRWFGGIAPRGAIDRSFRFFWNYLRNVAGCFDTVVCSRSAAIRLNDAANSPISSVRRDLV